MADGISFNLEGKDYNLDDFELGELEWLEEELGFSFASLESGNQQAAEALASMKSVTRIVYLIKKRDDPEYTLEQARKIKLSAVFSEEDQNGNGKAKPAKGRPTKPAGA
jgi:hypothetical protein